MNLSKYVLHFFVLAVILGGCANMAQGPTGGKKDIKSPVLLKSTPAQNARNVKEKRIEIDFDEYIQVNQPSQNLVVSPPQKSAPIAKAIGKKMVVQLKDSLLPNTTYTLDFKNCIGDYTENNLVKDFCYSFSTGETLDTLVISGTVLNAQDLLPLENICVGIYSKDVDSLFTTTRFERIGKTDARGRFSIKGVAGKRYKIYALEDLNNNYYYDQVGEGVALQEMELPIPTVDISYRHDTTYKDSATIDTIITKKVMKYAPDSFILRLFHKEVKLQEFNKIERSDRKYFTLYFKKAENSIPKITPVNFTPKGSWYMAESNKATDTITYWITDSAVYNRDSLTIATNYLITDSAENLVPHADTLIAGLTARYIKEEAEKAKEEAAQIKKYERRGKVRPRTNVIRMTNQNGAIEIADSLIIWWKYPLSTIKAENVHLSYTKDSTKVPMNFKIKRLDNQRSFFVDAELLPGVNYTLTLDSAAAFDYYGNHNNKDSLMFRKRTEDEYGNIKLKLSQQDESSIVQIINASGTVIMEKKALNGTVEFQNVTPGTYYAKLIEDKNNNGKWDTGVFKEKKQPENVYYFSKPLKIRAGWSVEEDWDVKKETIDKQRPGGLQAPKKKK